jgi:hypothetical protein
MLSSLGQRCTYGDSDSTDEANPEALTPAAIKANIIARLSSTNPREIMTAYSETIHPWFSIFSQSTLSKQHPTTWDTASVDFVLLCFAIILLNSAPRESQGTYVLSSELRPKYLMSKAWIALLEGAGLNSIDFVKARLLVNIFEVSHGLYPAAYLSVAATVRAADALAAFQPQGVSLSLAEADAKEYMIMWCGIAVIDGFVTQIICPIHLFSTHRPFIDSCWIVISQQKTAKRLL